MAYGPGAENVHAAWRMAIARRAAAGGYEGNRNVAALAVAGSVGAGLADRFSDLELDCYWVRPPASAERLAPGLTPERLAERLDLMSAGPPGERLRAAETLLAEVTVMAGTRSDAGISDFREALLEHRRAIDPPRPGAERRSR